MWATDNRCIAIKNVFDYIEDNPQQFDVSCDNVSRCRSNIIIIDKANGDDHKIYIDDSFSVSYIHWYKNDKLVIRNGYKHNCSVSQRKEYLPFGYDTYVAEALNDYIFDEIEDILISQKKLKTFTRHHNFELLNTSSTTKTLEITAPVTITITGTHISR